MTVKQSKLILLTIALLFVTLVITLIPTKKADAATANYNIAKRYIGLHESKNTGTLRRAMGINPRTVPWCGGFVELVVKRTGGKPVSGALRAKNWSRYGRKVSSVRRARKGDVVVIRTRRGYHVGFYAGHTGSHVKILGGNQSNRVKISNFRLSSIYTIRRR